MPPRPDVPELFDPVCHAPVSGESAFARVHGGALYFFCSGGCDGRFAADPSRWAVAAALGGIRSIAPPEGRQPEMEAAASEARSLVDADAKADAEATVAYRRPPEASDPVSGDASADDPRPRPRLAVAVNSAPGSAEVATRDGSERQASRLDPRSLVLVRNSPESGAAFDQVSAAVDPGERTPSDAHDFMAPLAAWRERHLAAVRCRELLKLHHTVIGARPDLAHVDLYRQIVVDRTGCDRAAADAILRHTQESFAAWPVSRELKFRDVVHYLIVSEILHSHNESRWVHADIRRVVYSSIPHEL